ncbi:MAG: putative ABC transport system permease protein [Pirellulaceae bacterium]|jgi:putative ABC transport system permease protein
MSVAGMLFTAGPTVIDAYMAKTDHDLEQLRQESDELLSKIDDETRKIMRDMGLNLRIVHKDTHLGDLHTEFKAVEFPEAYVHTLAKSSEIETVVHLIATLQHKTIWRGNTVLLVGVDPVLTSSQKNAEKKHMTRPIEKGTVVLGSLIGIGLTKGETIEIEGEEFTIASIQGEAGTSADVQLALNLHDAQRITNKEGKINQIMALNCKCKGDRISVIRTQLEKVLPDTRVTETVGIADAREKQRDQVAAARTEQLASIARQREKQSESMRLLANIVVPLVVFVCAAFIALQTWLNVRERRMEIGVLRALGKTTLQIGLMFLSKSLLLGFLGGLIGCASGYLLALVVGQQTLQVANEYVRLSWVIVVLTIFGAPLIAAMAAYLPTLKAVMQDPAIVLMDV